MFHSEMAQSEGRALWRRRAGVFLLLWMTAMAGLLALIVSLDSKPVRAAEPFVVIVNAANPVSSISAEKLSENIKAFVDSVAKAKPAGSKGTYIQRVAVSSTMGPGVKVEPGTLLG